MSGKKIVTVLGATGTQGQSVVNALLKNGTYAVRGITRNPDAPAAQTLKDKGVEVVSASAADKISLIKAFEGAYAVFGVTIPFTPEGEVTQGRNIVDAAFAAKVPLLVWSSLPGASEISGGKHIIPPFDDKSAVEKYIATTSQPTVILHTGWFTENLFTQHFLQPDPSDHNKWNVVVPVVPDAKMGTLWVEGDLGNIVLAVIDHWADESWRPKLTKEVIVAAPFEISVNEIVNTLKKVTGKDFKYVYKSDLPAGFQVLFKFFDDGYYRFPQSNILEELGVKTHSYEDFVRERVVPYLQSKQ
ncbi:NAD(P)-binding protein [Calocera cornea HHB12733]|uniref:NAD(P)-binding protein n=1 Tax=Calocera cornea HHB12733 TaxID=1353952 RepID=A0A165C7P5_9BASI|nr:NAD(P)-binding protein [Calocera cornea HHB12733]